MKDLQGGKMLLQKIEAKTPFIAQCYLCHEILSLDKDVIYQDLASWPLKIFYCEPCASSKKGGLCETTHT